MSKTNWDMYYNKPGKGVKVTRNITQNILLSLFKKHSINHDVICELGGANSCFFSGIRNVFSKSKYIIIDNNITGLNLFLKNHPDVDAIELLNQNLLDNNTSIIQSDIVFSIGLIEHFSKSETPKIIKEHFRAAKANSLVIISFPTPTILYRIVRSIAEILDIWRFPDERPLKIKNVELEVSKYGEILESFINWKIILTQGIIVVRPKVVASEVESIKLGEV